MKVGSSTKSGGIHRVCPAVPALEEGNGAGQCDLSCFTYILQARLEGSLGEAEKQEGRGGCGNLDWRPALGTVAHLLATLRGRRSHLK